uniref:Enoyl reductase (ER) domain-containing protein n=1 Tax=Chromera velia CCMP2878 TaxID=1169474 RepID=A0A0K6SAL1_9ALVE|eukprot:Cvel_11111.t2-p1 / transcript=Cvel_11111.t2 / gene=Cvel_11111 / organism=Chromera_velia_CCMP2878 / gene_product=Putative inactive phenolphthiocerol synthesis, putative / transcript_product=Putative inactive phenolphthiocerol synthesis, putative / location=Cvel_scaffold688:1246-6405(+) / protein_length=507 / sequence_SO=supercontig / SO=protein_coding / is_pseudo=false
MNPVEDKMDDSRGFTRKSTSRLSGGILGEARRDPIRKDASLEAALAVSREEVSESADSQEAVALRLETTKRDCVDSFTPSRRSNGDAALETQFDSHTEPPPKQRAPEVKTNDSSGQSTVSNFQCLLTREEDAERERIVNCLIATELELQEMIKKCRESEIRNLFPPPPPESRVTRTMEKMIEQRKCEAAELEQRVRVPLVGQSDSCRDLVEVHVLASLPLMNFDDELCQWYSGDPGPPKSAITGTATRIGSGVQGIRVGDEVWGIAGGGLKRRTVTTQQLIARKPRGLSSEQASVLAVNASTVEYALRDLGHVKEGQHVLIHEAAGELGFVAIQVCLRAGATVYATVGCFSEFQSLHNFNLPLISNSRSHEQFELELDLELDGKLLDVVFSPKSLTDEYIDTSLRFLRPEGKFLQIGRGNSEKRERVQQVAVDQIVKQQPEWFPQMLPRIASLVDEGHLSPLPLLSKSFELLSRDDQKHSVAAIYYLRSAPQVGSVIVSFGAEGGGR